MNYYNILGVPREASQEDIKNSYRKLAMKHHPDRGGDQQKFTEIQQAYDTLSDPQKRQQYDNPMPQGFGGGPGGFHFNVNSGGINDIFAQMFGGDPFNQFHQKRNIHQTYRTQVQITLEDSYNGSAQSLKLQLPTGVKVLTIEIPKGIDNGNQLRYDNVIDNGTLIIEFLILPNLTYERRGCDLYANYPISVLDLISGTNFDFKTISGKTLNVSVKPRTQPFMQLKIPGQGMPKNNSGQYGDQIILLKPYIPDIIDNTIIEAIQQANTNKEKG